MDRVFLITNGNIGGTAGDSTLILRRAKAMYEEKSVHASFAYKSVKSGKCQYRRLLLLD